MAGQPFRSGLGLCKSVPHARIEQMRGSAPTRIAIHHSISMVDLRVMSSASGKTSASIGSQRPAGSRGFADFASRFTVAYDGREPREAPQRFYIASRGLSPNPSGCMLNMLDISTMYRGGAR